MADKITPPWLQKAALPPVGETTAEQAIRFLTTLKIPEGPKAGQPLTLAPFQEQFVNGALADGINVACLSIGRGNAKTALSSGIALGALLGIWDDQPLGIIPGAATYGIPTTPVGAKASWAAFRAEVVAFMEANAITSPSQVNLGFDPQIWADLDDALIAGTAVSQWDRLTKQIGTPAISNLIPDDTAIMTATVQGIAPGYLGLYGGVDLIRDPYTKAASGALVLTGLVTADFTVPRGWQTRILTGLAGA